MASIALYREQTVQELPPKRVETDNMHYDYHYRISIALPSKSEDARELSPFLVSRSSKLSNQYLQTLAVASSEKRCKPKTDSSARDSEGNLFDRASLSTLLIDAVSSLKHGAARPEKCGISQNANAFVDSIDRSESTMMKAWADNCPGTSIQQQNGNRGKSFSRNDEQQQRPIVGEASNGRGNTWANGEANEASRVPRPKDWKPNWAAGEPEQNWEANMDEEVFQDTDGIGVYVDENRRPLDAEVQFCKQQERRKDRKNTGGKVAHVGKIRGSESGEIGVFGADKYFSAQDKELERQSTGKVGEDEFLPSISQETHRYSTAASSDMSSESWAKSNGRTHSLPEGLWKVQEESEEDSSLWSSPCSHHRAFTILEGREGTCSWSSSNKAPGGQQRKAEERFSVAEDEGMALWKRRLELIGARAAPGAGAGEEGASPKLWRSIVQGSMASRSGSTRRKQQLGGVEDETGSVSSTDTRSRSSSTREQEGRGKKKAPKQPPSPSSRLASFLSLFRSSSDQRGDQATGKTVTKERLWTGSSGNALPSTGRRRSCDEHSMAMASPPPPPRSNMPQLPTFYSNADMLPPNGKPPSPRCRRSASVARPSLSPASIARSSRPPSAQNPSRILPILAMDNNHQSVISLPRSLDCLDNQLRIRTSTCELQDPAHKRSTPEWIDDIKSVIDAQHMIRREADSLPGYGDSKKHVDAASRFELRKEAGSPSVDSPRSWSLHKSASCASSSASMEEQLASFDHLGRAKQFASSLRISKPTAVIRKPNLDAPEKERQVPTTSEERSFSFYTGLEGSRQRRSCEEEDEERERDGRRGFSKERMEEVASMMEERERRNRRSRKEVEEAERGRRAMVRVHAGEGMAMAGGRWQGEEKMNRNMEQKGVRNKENNTDYHEMSNLSQFKEKKKKKNEEEEEEEDCYYESDSSSDLFEIESLRSAATSLGLCRRDLPVYQTKDPIPIAILSPPSPSSAHPP